MRVVTARVHNSCHSGISVLNYCHSWDKFVVNTHLSHCINSSLTYTSFLYRDLSLRSQIFRTAGEIKVWTGDEDSSLGCKIHCISLSVCVWVWDDATGVARILCRGGLRTEAPRDADGVRGGEWRGGIPLPAD